MGKLRGKSPKLIKARRSKTLIFGPPGVGKTMFIASFPGVYMIDTEGGATEAQYRKRLIDSGGSYFGPDDGADDFELIVEEMKTLATTKHDYRTVGIDSLSKPDNVATAKRLNELLDDGRDEFALWGAQRTPASRMSLDLRNWATKADMNVIVSCHQKDVWEKVNGVRQVTGQTFDAWGKFDYEMDLVLQCVMRGKKRVAIIVKSRLANFTKGESFSLEYDEFAKRYGREDLERNFKPITLATEAQLKEFMELLEIQRVNSKTLEKWLKADNANDWAEMETVKMGKCIKWMRDRLSQPETETEKV